MNLIGRKCNSLWSYSHASNYTPAHRAFWRRSTCLPNSSLLGNVFRVAQEASGWIRFALTTPYRPLIYGEVLFWGDATVPAAYAINDDDDNV